MALPNCPALTDDGRLFCPHLTLPDLFFLLPFLLQDRSTLRFRLPVPMPDCLPCLLLITVPVSTPWPRCEVSVFRWIGTPRLNAILKGAVRHPTCRDDDLDPRCCWFLSDASSLSWPRPSLRGFFPPLSCHGGKGALDTEVFEVPLV